MDHFASKTVVGNCFVFILPYLIPPIYTALLSRGPDTQSFNEMALYQQLSLYSIILLLRSVWK
jgi:hypothetical protein